MEKLIPFHDAHVVSAAEAAYNGLFGAVIPRIGWRWFQASDWPQLPAEPLPWVIEAMSVGIANSAGEELQGRIISLFAPWPYGQGITELPSTTLYNWGNRCKLLRPTKVQAGVGCYVRLPCVAATNVIDVNVLVRQL